MVAAGQQPRLVIKVRVGRMQRCVIRHLRFRATIFSRYQTVWAYDPGEIAGLQAEMAKLNAQLSDGGLYTADPVRFRVVTTALAAAGEKLAVAEERWLALEMLREEMGG